MTTGFKPFSENSKAKKLLVPQNATITDHQVVKLKKGESLTFSKIKEKFIPDLVSKPSNSRFTLSEHVASQLSLEKEEELRFENKVSEEVQKRLNLIEKEAKENAYKDGFEQGKKDAFESERLNLASRLEILAKLIKSIEIAKEQLANQYEHTLLDISFRIAQTIIKNEIKNKPEIISHTISDILSRISKDEEVVIKISSKEFELLNLIKSDLESLNRSGRMSFEINENMQSGDCLVESKSGEIGSYIDQKIEQLREILFSNTLKSSQNHEPNHSGATGT